MKREEKIDKLIRQHLKKEESGVDFTYKLIQKISVIETMKEQALQQLAKKYLPEKASEDFTLKVMRKISAEREVFVYQPVISKKVWGVIFGVLSVFIVAVLLFSDKGTQRLTIANTYFNKFINVFSADYPGILNSPLFAMSMFAMSALLFLDYYIRNKKYS